MYLLDTNVVLEVLFERQNASDAALLFQEIPGDRLWISDFSLFSIGIYLFRGQRAADFSKIVNDLFLASRIGLARLIPADILRIESFSSEYGADFDDAYQCLCAERYGLTIVSFDADFDRFPMGRMEPREVLAAFRNETRGDSRDSRRHE